MSILGYFKYHIHEIIFKDDDKKLNYTVTCIQRTLKTINDPVDDKTEMQIYQFSDLNHAVTEFENRVKHCLNQVSFTDLSLT